MLQHVAHETRPEDVDAVVAFWALLGFARVEPPPTLRERAVWMQRGGTQVHLLLTGDPVVPPSGHAAVVAEDYGPTIAALRAAGHPVEPRAEHWGAPRAFATDPSGHRVEVMSVAPPG
jgi:catechol 2,3-dioxygenase-like lactoylglutathione lyase family enzyme